MHRLLIHKTDEGFQVAPIDSQGEVLTTQSLTSWAEAMPDLTQVSLVLHAKHYLVRWVDMPGVKARQQAKALPFALEESLIQEVDQYLILPDAQQGSKVRAYVIEEDFLDRLIQACKLENIELLNLIPVTAFVQEPWLIQRFEKGWFVNLYGHHEAWVSDLSLAVFLESCLDGINEKKLLIKAQGLDQAQLMRSNIETGFAEAFVDIDVQVESADVLFTQEPRSNAINFLANRLQHENKKESKPIWFKSLVILAAACLVIWFAHLNITTHQLENQSTQVRKQANRLYKQLFPGERIRALKRQFKAKLSGSSEPNAVDFMNLIDKTAKVHVQHSGVVFNSFNFSERNKKLALDVQAPTLSSLQSFKDALIQQGLDAEILSANNDQGKIKGRMSITKTGGAS